VLTSLIDYCSMKGASIIWMVTVCIFSFHRNNQMKRTKVTYLTIFWSVVTVKRTKDVVGVMKVDLIIYQLKIKRLQLLSLVGSTNHNNLIVIVKILHFPLLHHRWIYTPTTHSTSIGTSKSFNKRVDKSKKIIIIL
jgi:hypothetical protein